MPVSRGGPLSPPPQAGRENDPQSQDLQELLQTLRRLVDLAQSAFALLTRVLQRRVAVARAQEQVEDNVV